MSSQEYKSVGFVGLGLMGSPMVEHLAKKLPAETRIHVFDVVDDAVNKLCSNYPDKVVKGSSAKDVADKSVSRLRPIVIFIYYDQD